MPRQVLCLCGVNSQTVYSASRFPILCDVAVQDKVGVGGGIVVDQIIQLVALIHVFRKLILHGDHIDGEAAGAALLVLLQVQQLSNKAAQSKNVSLFS